MYQKLLYKSYLGPCYTRPTKKWRLMQTKGLAFANLSANLDTKSPRNTTNHVNWVVDQKMNYLWFDKTLSSCWWKEPVEIEWQCVELFISVISSECSELHPPRHPPIFHRLLYLQRVVKKHRHYQSYCWWRWEEGIHECIELQKKNT